VRGQSLSPKGETDAQSELALEQLAREVLAEEALAFAEALREPDSRQRYHRLAEAASQGSIPQPLLPALEAMLEIVLQTQRIRRQHGPAAEQALIELFGTTPRGSRLRRAAREVTQALQALRGQRLESLNVTAGPGTHTLTIQTEACQVTLKIDPAGCQLASLEV
jgi:hypothetical protein